MSRIDPTTLISYEPTGGTCCVPGCKGDAPIGVLLGRVMPMRCRAHEDAHAAEEEAEQRALNAAKYMTTAGMTERLGSFTLASYEEKCGDEAGRAALAVARRWIKTYVDTGGAPNLILFGPPGSGKTGLAWSIVRDLVERGIEARYVNFRKLLEELRDAYRKQVSAEKWLAAMISSPVLCLDDLGSEVPTEWACAQLLGMVDARYEKGLPTIFCSNYEPDRLAQRLGKHDPIVGLRIVSRMDEGATQHRLLAGDRRRAA